MGVGVILASLIEPLTRIVTRRQERKSAKEVLKGQLQKTRADGDLKLDLNDQTWEVASAAMQGDTWKDELATIVVLSPYILLVLGGILAAFGREEVLVGTVGGIYALTEAGVDVGFLMETVVLAAVSLSVWRKF